METLYDAGVTPDPGCARSVLAFILCPAAALSGGAAPEPDELEAIEELMAPVKEEAVRRWHSVSRAKAAC